LGKHRNSREDKPGSIAQFSIHEASLAERGGGVPEKPVNETANCEVSGLYATGSKRKVKMKERLVTAERKDHKGDSSLDGEESVPKK